MDQSGPIELDFKGISFISRSFCHELLSNIKTKKNIKFKNTNTEIENMINAVTNQKNKDKIKIKHIKEVDLSKVDLSKVDLSKVDLSKVDLSKVVLKA